jgi:hypothetical protein
MFMLPVIEAEALNIVVVLVVENMGEWICFSFLEYSSMAFRKSGKPGLLLF